MIKLLSLLALSGVSAFAAAAPAPAHRELRLGLLAHMNGDDASALKHFARCRRLAARATPDADSCGIYEDVFGKGKPKGDGASKPEARAVYRAGVAAFKKGDMAAADKSWHDCLGLSEVATSVRYDCLAAIDLLPEKVPGKNEAAARAVYMEGLTSYMKGDDDKAADAWTRCAQTAPGESGTERDCRAGLAKLKTR